MVSWLISFSAAILAVGVVFLSMIGISELYEYLEKKRASNVKLHRALCTIRELAGPAIGMFMFIAVLTWVMHGCLFESN